MAQTEGAEAAVQLAREAEMRPNRRPALTAAPEEGEVMAARAAMAIPRAPVAGSL